MIENKQIKIAYLLPGSGGTFYCGNCLRDKIFVKSLKDSGHDILMIPMYLPLNLDEYETDSPIFYGAVNIYLEQIHPLFKKLPLWIKKLLDSKSILDFAAKQSASTNANGHEEMTISMLKGSEGKQSDDLDTLINWLKVHEKPDVVHISNALLSGMAKKLKSELDCKIVCTLQDEDEWIDEMRPKYAAETWKLIESNSEHIDAFIAVSEYFAKLIKTKVNIPPSKIHVIHNFIGQDYIHSEKLNKPVQTIGYMSKINSAFGADLLFEAFATLKKEEHFADLKLIYTGGFTDDYKKIVSEINKKSKKLGFEKDIEFIEDLSAKGKQKFLESITLYCVPSRRKEAFGIHILEAQAYGVPSVMPDIGAYSEIITKTKTGLLYDPSDPLNLTNSLRKLLIDNELYSEFQNNCKTSISSIFDSTLQTNKIVAIYKKCIDSIEL